MGSRCWIYWNLLQTDKSFIIFSVSLPKCPLRWTFAKAAQTLRLSYNHCNEVIILKQLKYAHEDSSWIIQLQRSWRLKLNIIQLQKVESPDELLLWDAAVAVNVEGFKQLPVAQIIIIKWCNYMTTTLHDNYITGQLHYMTTTLHDDCITEQLHYRTNTLQNTCITGQLHYRTTAIQDNYITGQLHYRTTA